MKKVLPIALSLMFLSACTAGSLITNLPEGDAPAVADKPNEATAPSESPLNAETINTEVEYFDFMLLNQANNVLRPVLPQDIEYIRVNGKEIKTSELHFPGASSAKALMESEEARLKEAEKVMQGNQMGLFAGSGIYGFFVKASQQNTAIDVKLKGEAQSYRILRVNNMTRGTFVLQDGAVSGAFKTDGAFEIKQTASEFSAFLALAQVFTNLSSYFDPNNFDLNAFANSYFAEGLNVKVTTSSGQVLEFSTPEFVTEANQAALDQGTALDEEAQAEMEETQAEMAELLETNKDYVQYLMPFDGSWEPESRFILGLIPGGKLELDFRADSAGRATFSVTTASQTFSRSAEISTLTEANGAQGPDKLDFDLSSGGDSLAVSISLENANRMKVVLTSTNIEAFSALVNKELYLARLK